MDTMQDLSHVNRREMLSVLGASVLGTALPAAAQSEFPNKPLRIVLGLPAGGAADVTVRMLAQEMERSMKQPVIVDNKPGGLYQVAVQAVASAPADGYTILYVNSSFVTVQATQKRFDLLRQFQPLTMTGDVPSVLLVNANSKFKTLKEMVDYGRAHPNELTYGTLGVGSLEHLKTLQFCDAAGIDARAIPYKGGPDMINAVLAGDLSFTGVNAYSAANFIQSGRVRALTAMDTVRIKYLPNVPTVAEAGVKAHTSRIWSGYMVPVGTPAPVAQRLFTEMVNAMNTPAMSEKLTPLGIQISTNKNPDEFRKFIASELEWMTAVSKKIDLVNN
jgi:tripartite-type tricarboxylate transporter receptor subunit TctC